MFYSIGGHLRVLHVMCDSIHHRRIGREGKVRGGTTRLIYRGGWRRLSGLVAQRRWLGGGGPMGGVRSVDRQRKKLPSVSAQTNKETQAGDMYPYLCWR